MTNHLTQSGSQFIARFEGFVSHRYIDAVGVPTIGYGFTLRSWVFREWWRVARGKTRLDKGDTISRSEARQVLAKLVDEEYGAAVSAYVGRLEPWQYDGASSACYNLGPGAIKWRWGRALRDGDVPGAATILSNNYNTAGGRKLAGLVRRRKEEGRLIANGDYGSVAASSADRSADAALLTKLGYNASDFVANTRRFQQDHPPLKVDGAFGPATRATARRALEAKRATKAGGTAGAAGGGTATAVGSQGGAEWLHIAAIVGTVAAVAILAWVLYRNRGRIWNALPDSWRERLNTWRNGD